MHDYQYEVAFSFVKEDEELATRLNDLLQDMLPTFLYSKKQEAVAATDGEETFNRVFGTEARIVVVLYRPAWGTTPWTRIEETAIRNRAYEEGYDFTVFIPLQNSPEAPAWLPKTRIWVGLERWGIEGAASVIESRVQEAGGMPRTETIDDHVARRKRQIDQEKKRKLFLASDEGVKAAAEEMKQLAAIIEATAQRVSAENNLALKTAQKDQGRIHWVEVCSDKFCVAVNWVSLYTNTLNESTLEIELWKGLPRRPGRTTFFESQRHSQRLFGFDLDSAWTKGWRETDRSQLLSSQAVAQLAITMLIDHLYGQELGDRA
jgi:hypothetical protein